jgi:DNA replication ATP-dependent helicase Dna2
VVDLAPPRFSAPAAALSQLPPAESSRLAQLNREQREAVGRILGAEDYALVLGMPGTGKTSLIAQAVRALAALGRSVLLTAYTHSAVDNVLLKLADGGVPFLRLGAVSRVDPRLRPHTLDALCEGAADEAELARAASSSSATTTSCRRS